MSAHVIAQGPRLGASAASAAQSPSTIPRRPDRRVMPETSPAFEVSTERIDDGRVVVSVMGDLDIATARALERTLFDVAEHQAGGVIVDITGCTFLDSFGARALIASRARLDRSDQSFALVLSNPRVLRILQITHLDEVFEIYPVLATAVDGNGRG